MKKKSKLALPPIHNIGKEEIALATKVLKSGPLSGFLASPGKKFLGGENVLKLEKAFAKKFKIKHAVSFNSATTALQSAVASLGIGPGDEVIVPPYTMSASATCVLLNGAVPIFADIDEKTLCIDSKSVLSKISSRTKAIISVNLLGQSADYDELLILAKKHNLKIIEDNAQAPGAKYNGKYTGTIGDMGIFSFNIHKTIQAGEGGMLVTNDDKIALRAQLVRNHGEVVVDTMSGYDAGPIIGSNYRMPEIIAAVMLAQLPRLDFLNRERVKLAKYLHKKILGIKGIVPAHTHKKNTHVYYRFALFINEKELGLSRNSLIEAMSKEGFELSKGYVKPIYLLPVFKERKAFNNTHFPFEYEGYSAPEYKLGMCPVVERLYEKEFTLTDICQYPFTKKHVDLFVEALKKVIKNRDEKNTH